MMRLFLIFWVGLNLAYATSPQPSFHDPLLLPWLLISLIASMVMIWAMYKAVKTKNPRYGYLILAMGGVMIGLLFL